MERHTIFNISGPGKILLMLTGAMFAVVMYDGAILQAGDPNTGLLQVPLRWCAVEGSPAAVNPGSLGEPDTDNVLWRRHERASDRTWIPQANLTFRSAFTNQVMNQANFPIIKDPSPPPTGKGALGDILDPRINDTELKQAKAACESAWNALATQFNTPLLGPIAININQFVDSNGNLPSDFLRGYGGFTTWSGSAGASVCTNPPSGLTSASGGYLAISDYSFLRGFDQFENILAHELGHVLTLDHGNGVDDDDGGNGPYDLACDSAENVNATPFSLMTAGQQPSILTALQRGTSRGLGRVYSGAQIDPPAQLLNGDAISDQRIDSIQDVADPSIDMTSVTMTEHIPTQTTVFTHSLFGVISPGSYQYLVFADLDGNPATGGAPANLNLGVPTAFQGVELVTRVVVTTIVNEIGTTQTATPTVWKFQGGSFAVVSDPSIIADVTAARGGEPTGQAQFGVVSIQMSDSVRGPAVDRVRIQAYAAPAQPPPGPRIATSPAFDQLPDGPSPDSGVQLNLVQPQFPVCAVTPTQAQPGRAVTVEATGLFANQMAKVMLGDVMVGGGNTTGAGTLTLNFTVPFTSALGPRLVTVGVVGTALTADCMLEVVGPVAVAVPVAIDVRPASCPNPINVTSNGVIAVAILGSNTLDVSHLDPSLVRLEGVAPLRSIVRDVATPFLPITGRTAPNHCTRERADGHPDLLLHFDAQTLGAALGAVNEDQVLVLKLTGNFAPGLGGAPISGEDVVVIHLK